MARGKTTNNQSRMGGDMKRMIQTDDKTTNFKSDRDKADKASKKSGRMTQ